MLKLLRPVRHYKYIFPLYKCERYKGHSKWQNIRHIKAQKDLEKSKLIMHHIKRMRLAIAANNGNMNLETNTNLANIIDQAKKQGISPEILKNFLSKFEEHKKNATVHFITFKAQNGLFILVQLLTDNLKAVRMLLNAISKKTNTTILDNVPKGLFDHKGIIITSPQNLDKATEDAINCNAEEVEEIEENETTYLQFICEPQKLMIVKTQLEKVGYEIIKAEEEFFARQMVALTEDQQTVIEKLYARLEMLEEVVGIFNNIE